MQDALLLVSEDWRKPILGCLFLALFVLICVVMDKAERKLPAVRDAVAVFGSYYILAILFCLYVLAVAFREAVFLLDTFSGSAIFGWAVIGMAATYIAAFFRSVCKLATLQPGALRLTRMFLVSFALFATFFPFVVFVICAWWMGKEYTFADYAGHRDLFITFLSSCLFSVPGLLYFALSSKVKKLAF